MDLLIKELDSAAPVKIVAKPGSPIHPNPLNFLAPAGLHDLVEVQADADIIVTRNKGQGRVAGKIKTPGRDADIVNNGAVLDG